MTNKYTDSKPDINPLMLVCTEELSKELTCFYDKAEDVRQFMVNRKDSNPTLFAGDNDQSNDDINAWQTIENDAAVKPGMISYKSNNPPSNFDQAITTKAPTNILTTADREVISLTNREKIITGPKAEPKPAQA